MSTTLKILVVLTSQATMGDDPRPTGVWFEELSTPYYAFVDAGAQVDIASIAGGKIPIDPHSLDADGKTDLLSTAWAEGKVISAVCHGPAGLVNVKDANGHPLVAGRSVAAFTNSEEAAAGLTEKVPFLLETRIRGLGANYQSGPDFQPFAVRDGQLVTGQNPASSEKVAELVLEAVREAQ